ATQQGFGGFGDIAGADQLELVATVADFQCQSLFDQAQVLVELAAEIGEAVGFKGFEGEAMRFYGGVQGLLGDRAQQIRKTKNSAVNGKKQWGAIKAMDAKPDPRLASYRGASRGCFPADAFSRPACPAASAVARRRSGPRRTGRSGADCRNGN